MGQLPAGKASALGKWGDGVTWPAMMKAETAASYLDMSRPAFLREVAQGRLPEAIMLGGREHWRKDALDKAIDALTAQDLPSWKRKLLHGPKAA